MAMLDTLTISTQQHDAMIDITSKCSGYGKAFIYASSMGLEQEKS